MSSARTPEQWRDRGPQRTARRCTRCGSNGHRARSRSMTGSPRAWSRSAALGTAAPFQPRAAGAIVVTPPRTSGRPADTKARRLLGIRRGPRHIDPNAEPSLAECATAAAIAAKDRIRTRVGLHHDIGTSPGSAIQMTRSRRAGGVGRIMKGGRGRLGSGRTARSGSADAPDEHRRRFLSSANAGMCGLFTLHELVEKLRGAAGDRQATTPVRIPERYRGGHEEQLLGHPRGG